MKQNIGTTDKIIRIVLGVFFCMFFFNHIATPVINVLFLVLAVVFLSTSLLGFCPLYTLIGKDTNKA